MVPAGSALRSVAEVDAAGVRIAVTGRSAYGLWLDRNIQNAELVRSDSLDFGLPRSGWPRASTRSPGFVPGCCPISKRRPAPASRRPVFGCAAGRGHAQGEHRRRRLPGVLRRGDQGRRHRRRPDREALGRRTLGGAAGLRLSSPDPVDDVLERAGRRRRRRGFPGRPRPRGGGRRRLARKYGA